MNRIKIKLIDNDFAVRATENIDFHDNQDRKFASFLQSLTDQLVTGDTAEVEIEGLDRPVKFWVGEAG